MGVFLGTFAFALLGLSEVSGESSEAPPFVPGLLVTGALLLTLASLYMFLFYIHHISRRIQASSIIAAIGEETVNDLQRLYPEMEEEETPEESGESLGPTLQTIAAKDSNTIVSVDEKGLVQLAEENGSCFRMLSGVGESVVTGQELVDVFGKAVDDEDRVLKHIHLGEHRTMEQDLRYGFRQLVDVAVRALSPGVNDPSTAVQALDRLHDLLRQLGQRDFPDPVHSDDRGEMRLVMQPQTWESFVRLAVEEIVHYGSDAPAVKHRLRRMYNDLIDVLPAERAVIVRVVGADTGWI
jgi:uncharacterized membrane protein